MTCPNAAKHTPAPRGFLAWHGWADRMHKRGYRNNIPCPGCGLFMIWAGGRGKMVAPDDALNTPCLSGGAP